MAYDVPRWLRCFRIKNQTLRFALSEFFGTFLLMLIGNAAEAQYLFSGGDVGMHNYLSLNISWMIAVMVGVQASYGVSGGHINPSVSLADAIIGRLKWRHLPIYMFSQYLGSFAASAVVYITYYDALNFHDGGVRQVIGPNATAVIWATYPASNIGWWNCLVDQIVGTGVLMIGVMAMTDERNTPVPSSAVPVAVGFVVLVIGTSFGFNCGYAINPARDLAPRLFTALAGWGWDTFSVYDHFFWIPIAGPHIGAIVGSLLYMFLVEIHHVDDQVDDYVITGTPELNGKKDIGLDDSHSTTKTSMNDKDIDIRI